MSRGRPRKNKAPKIEVVERNNQSNSEIRAEANKGQTVTTTKTDTSTQASAVDQKTAPGQTSMLEKTEVNSTTKKEDNNLARIIALAIIIFGLIVIIAVAILVLVTRFAPRVDKTIAVPSLEKLDEYTNDDKVTVKGVVSDDSKKVIIYVNDKAQGKLVNVSDGSFSYDYEFDGEGEYKFEAAAVKGTIVRSRSEKSESVKTTYDVTPPSTDVDLKYDSESDTDKVTISGEGEKDTTITLKKGDTEYNAETDDEGKFEIKDITLDEGDNEFEVTIKDRAGNSVKLSDNVKISYKKGDLNGAGASVDKSGTSGTGTSASGSSTELPNSAGELDAVLGLFRVRELMVIFGVIAFGLLSVNTGLVVWKLKR